MTFVRVLSLLALSTRVFAGAMTAQDRQHLVVHLEMTGSWLADEVRGLSQEQLNYRSSPDRWTILECVSHLAISEPDYWRDLMKSVKAPASDKPSALTDADVLWYGIDRVQHTKTGGGHEKVETYKSLGEALGVFQKLRGTMLEYVKTTDDDLRAHRYGTRQSIDCWQWMLEVSTHSQRHILQIREIKAEPGFPKR